MEVFTPNSAPRYYVSVGEKKGRWDLVNVKVRFLDKTQSIQEFISKIAPKAVLLTVYLSQQQT